MRTAYDVVEIVRLRDAEARAFREGIIVAGTARDLDAVELRRILADVNDCECRAELDGLRLCRRLAKIGRVVLIAAPVAVRVLNRRLHRDRSFSRLRFFDLDADNIDGLVLVEHDGRIILRLAVER